jgi:hypothetical protein
MHTSSGRFCALHCGRTHHLFLVDTGAVYSVLPYQSEELEIGPPITSYSGKPIPCWGWRELAVVSGGSVFFARGSVAGCGAGAEQAVLSTFSSPPSPLIWDWILYNSGASPYPTGHWEATAGRWWAAGRTASGGFGGGRTFLPAAVAEFS